MERPLIIQLLDMAGEETRRRGYPKKTRTAYDEMKERALRTVGAGYEPDWDAYDRACELEDDERFPVN